MSRLRAHLQLHSSGLRGERGSLPLAMLAAIVLAGVIIALYTQVQSGQLTARRDRDYQGAIQTADAGIQAAFTHLAAIEATDPALPAIDGFYPTDPNAPGVVADEDDTSVLYATGDVGEGSYAWRAKRIQTTLWEVRSAGTYRGSTRYVEALLGEQPIFPFALFGNDPLDLSTGGGGNSINSMSDTIPRLGSNGVMDLQSHHLQAVPENLILECFGEGAAEDCPEETITHRTEVPFEDLATTAYGDGGECTDPDTGEVIDDGILDWPRFEAGGLVEGEVYCFSQVLFEAGSGSGLRSYPLTPADPPTDEPTRIFINPKGDTRTTQGGGAGGGDSVGVHVSGTGTNLSEVNWLASGAEPGALTSSASDLLIFVPGTRTVKFGNNSSRVAAGIYAPYSTCDLRAQGEIVGSVICGSIQGSAGGWTLTYDDRLANYSLDDVYSVLSWSEQPEGLSGFAW